MMEGMSLGILDDELSHGLVEGLSRGINERVSNGSVQRRGVWIMAGYHQRKDNHQEYSYMYL